MLGLASQASSPGPFHQGKPAQLTPFLSAFGTDNMTSTPFFFEKNR
jgi:hypothetical protein